VRLGVAEGRPYPPRVLGDDPDQKRHGDEGHGGEAPVDEEKDDRHSDEEEDVDDHLRQDVGDESLKGRRIIDRPGHQLAGLLVLIVFQREALEMVVDSGSEVGDDSPAGDVGHPVAEELENAPAGVGQDDDEGEEADRVQPFRPVSGPLGDHRH